MSNKDSRLVKDLNLMSVDYLISTESDVKLETMSRWGRLNDELNSLISYLFNIQHFCNEGTNPEAEDSYFQTIAYSSYMRLPYTLHCAQNHWINGYYLESFILLRHIIEGFASLRYFEKNKNLVKAHVLKAKSKDRIKFIDMFESVSKGFYKVFYARFYSDFTHGGIAAMGTRIRYTSQTDGKVFMGCKFDNNYSDWILDHLLTFSYGYLNYSKVFFPTMFSRMPTKLKKEINFKLFDILNILNMPKDHRKTQEIWNNIVKPFVII